MATDYDRSSVIESGELQCYQPYSYQIVLVANDGTSTTIADETPTSTDGYYTVFTISFGTLGSNLYSDVYDADGLETNDENTAHIIDGVYGIYEGLCIVDIENTATSAEANGTIIFTVQTLTELAQNSLGETTEEETEPDIEDNNVDGSELTLVTSDPSGYFGSLLDYMGVSNATTANWLKVTNNTLYPTPDNLSDLTQTIKINALPFRAVNKIFNEWFRDENLQDSLEVPTDDGVDDGSIYTLFKRGKYHDYFTSALPWTQKGDAVELALGELQLSDEALANGYVEMPLGIVPKGTVYHSPFGQGSEIFPSTNYSSSGNFKNNTFYPLSGRAMGNNDNNNVWDHSFVNDDSITIAIQSTDLATLLSSQNLILGSTSINDLREAFAIQSLLERDARGGTRYTEILRSHFGVISQDARLQRPEYLGGSSSLININTVAQTSSTNETSPQGNLAAYGVLADSFHGFNKSFVEHGYIIGFINIRADLTYQQGLNRIWTRETRYDFYWPSLANLGEQAVLNKEIYFQNNASIDDGVFGYQERYAEYRYFPSMITGLFRSAYRESLDYWHLAQFFETLPTLSSEFIQDDTPIERVIANVDEPHFLLDVWFTDRCVRPMPMYAVPGVGVRF